jgi:polyisoprenyl-teichoic acid--peptidoglycan teichoic acid transferase
MIRRHPVLATVVILPTVLVLSFSALVALWLAGVQVPGASAARWFTITKTANADYTPAPDQPVFILAIGNDGRPGDTVTRGDAIHLIGVNPTTHTATMLDLPRDTGLDIPGHGRDKVNASHTYGGPRLEADTIGQAVGVKIPYVIDTDFAGFIGMVNDMGGLQVNVPYAMHDTFSGAEFAAGPQMLNGEQALAYARNRHQFPNSDLTRTQNQGYLILQALTQLRAKNTGPIETLDLLADLGRHAQLDGIGLKDLYALSRLGLSVDPSTVKNVLVPVASGSGSMLQLGADAQSLFADFRDDATLQTH